MICSYPLRCVTLGRADLTCAPGSARTETHDSVRVEFESPRGVRKTRIDPTTRVKSPRGHGRDWPKPWPSRSMGKYAWPRRNDRLGPCPAIQFPFGSRGALRRLTIPILGEAWAA